MHKITKNCLKLVFLAAFLASFNVSVAHSPSPLPEDGSLAIEIFHKALVLAPEIVNETQSQALVPYVKMGDKKIYLNSQFWLLVGAWLRVYKAELDKQCDCQFTPEEVLKKAQDYPARNLIQEKVANFSKSQLQLFTFLSSQYGYIAAVLKLTAEVAETVLSFVVGGKGVHIVCNVIDVLIFPAARGIQKISRKYTYGNEFKNLGLWIAFKYFFSKNISRATDRVFFEINQGLNLKEEELLRLDQEGFKPFLKNKGNRLEWMSQFVKSHQDIGKSLSQIDEALKNTAVSSSEKRALMSKKKKLVKKLEKASQVNYKKFFGTRYKRFLWLISRKWSPEYMLNKSGYFKKIFKGNLNWPILLQEDFLEPVLDKKAEPVVFSYAMNDVKTGLIEEFLANQSGESFSDDKKTRDSLRYLLEDIEKIFDTSLPTEKRQILAESLTFYMATFFAYYVKSINKLFIEQQQTGFFQKLQLQWRSGAFVNSANRLGDFLHTVALIQDPKKLNLYKYETMEQLLLFWSYLDRAYLAYKKIDSISYTELFEFLDPALDRIKTFSLGQQKKTVLSFIPFHQSMPKCLDLTKVR